MPINPEAINYVKLTVSENKLGNRVRYYVSDVLNGIPESERFDLVVGNPPHFNENTLKNHCKYAQCDQIDLLKSYDEGWKLHRSFYLNIRKFLNKGANILLVENSKVSSEGDFIGMINEGGLKYVGVIRPTLEDIIYASYIYRKGIGSRRGLMKIARRYSMYKVAFSLGLKAHYKSLINTINSLSKFYFIWSKN